MIIITVIVLALIVLPSYLWVRRLVRYQQDLFTWHCQEIYPFHERLSTTELEYIEGCIRHSYWEVLRTPFSLWDPLLSKLSFFSYSQRIAKNKVNKSRIAYGATILPSQVYPLALKVINERGLKPPKLNDDITFYGLGWDIEEGHLKVYYRFNDIRKIPDEFQLLTKTSTDEYLDQGLISWIYSKDNTILERRIYRYPKSGEEAHLISDRRMDRQVDSKVDDKWKDQINQEGRDILALYGRHNHLLDTITMKDKDHFTLYFPTIS